MDKLLPCPFCGSAAKICEDEEGYFCVACMGECFSCTEPHGEPEHAADTWNQRTPDPALLALARLGARLCRDQLSPTGGFCHAPYAVLDRMGVEEGVLIVGYPDATGPVMKDGIRKAIADILGPVGGYIMGGNEEL